MTVTLVLTTRYFGAPCEDIKTNLGEYAVKDLSVQTIRTAARRAGYTPTGDDTTDNCLLDLSTCVDVEPPRNADCSWIEARESDLW